MTPLVILFLESLGGGELMVIMLFILLFFGSKNIPSLARGLGKGIREFKDAMSGVQNEIQQGIHHVETHINNETESIKAVVNAEDPNVSTTAAPEAQQSTITTENNPVSFTTPPASEPRG